jgi:hypothetical protein
MLGALVIGGAGLWYRVGSDSATSERQQRMYQDYSGVRADVKRVVKQLDSPEGLVDSAGTLRDDQRVLERLVEPAEGQLEKRIKLQQRQINQILRLIRLNADFDTPEATENAVKADIRSMERKLQAPLGT